MEDSTKARLVEVADDLLKAHLDAVGKVLDKEALQDRSNQRTRRRIRTRIAGRLGDEDRRSRRLRWNLRATTAAATGAL